MQPGYIWVVARRALQWRASSWGSALSNPGVRLGYGLSLAGMCFAVLAVWLAGPGGSVAFIAPVGLFALSVAHHVMTAHAFHKRQ